MRHNRSTYSPVNAMTGFSLIELMFVVVIIAILAGTAIPAYSEYLMRAARSDAHIMLAKTAQSLERCRSTYGSYNNSGCAVDFPITSDEGYYQITAANGVLNATSYTLTATPVTGSRQAGDSDCTSFTLNNAGVESAKGANSNRCW